MLRIRQTLQLNILIAFAGLLVITVCTIVLYMYQQNSKTMLELSNSLIDQVTNAVLNQTTNHLIPAASIAQKSTENPALKTLTLVDNVDLEQYGMQILNLYPQLAGFFVGNEQGDFIFTKRFPDGSIGTQVIDRSLTPPVRTWTYRDEAGVVTDVDITTDFTYDPRERPWYIGSAESNQQYWTDIYIFFTDQKPGITAAYPIIDEQAGLRGVIGVDVALDELSEFLQTQVVGQTGVTFIVSAEGNVIAYPGISVATPDGESFRPLHISELDDPWVTAAYSEHQQKQQARFTFSYAGQRYMASFTPFPETFGKNWEIGVVVSEDDFIGGLQRTNQNSLLIAFVILSGAVILAIFMSRSISQPIVLLTEETKKIKDFQLDSNLKINSHIHEVQLLGDSIVSMRQSLKTFKKYVPAELVYQVIRSGEVAELGGHQKELTIFFSDVAEFTAISEGMVPEDLMRQLSNYLGSLATIIRQTDGTVDKYMGDGLMAFWGAPLANPNHAYNACLAALQCQIKVIQLNQQWQKDGKPIFITRIGLHTGETLVGNMGSTERMNYTVLGDSVNLASRLEPINKIYGTDIIVSAATYHKVVDRFYFRPLDIVTVKGKQRGVLLYELLGEIGHTASEKIELGERFTQGFDAYLAQDWETAIEIFQSLNKTYPDDIASQIYLNRCTELRHQPPDVNWRPIVNLTSKG